MPILADDSPAAGASDSAVARLWFPPGLVLASIVDEIATAWRGQPDQLPLAATDAFMLALTLAIEAPEYAQALHRSGIRALGQLHGIGEDVIRRNARRAIERYPIAFPQPVPGVPGAEPPSGGLGAEATGGTVRVPHCEEVAG